MDIKTIKMGMAMYLTPDGPLTDESVAVLRSTVDQVKAEGLINLVIDLRQVTLITSQGLEYLLDLRSELSKASGSLRLASPNAVCSDILTMTKLNQSIPVFDDLKSAGRSFL